MTTFALVHGGWHGAWCWELLTPQLEEAGHEVVAMDLPCDDGSATNDDYADVVCDVLDGREGDVVLVGHSFGGHTIPLVAARRPVRHLVYLCALVPRIGSSMADQVLDEPDMLVPGSLEALSEPDEQGRREWADPEAARNSLFADCDDISAAAAIQRLRPQALHPALLPCPLDEFPAVSCTYVVTGDDQMVNPNWSRRIARDRLGAELVELPGSHSPFLSRPQALADVLVRLTN